MVRKKIMQNFSPKSLAGIDRKVSKILISKGKELLEKKVKKNKNLKIFNKGNEGKATELDLWVEKQLMIQLKKIAPKYQFISEEDSFFSSQKSNENRYLTVASGFEEPFWLIDPIDGTNNFINDLSYYCISVALVSQNEIIGGWIYQPTTKELFRGLKGLGSFLGIGLRERRLDVSKTHQTSLENALIGTSHFHQNELDSCNSSQDKMNSLLRVAKVCRSTRKMGSAALDLAYCSIGKLDGYWQGDLKPWDIAAASIICIEAGLKVTDLLGNNYEAMGTNICVAPFEWHDQLLNLVKSDSVFR